MAGQEAAFCVAPSGPAHRPRGRPSSPDGGGHLPPGRPHRRASALALPALGEPHAPLLGGEGSLEALPVCSPERVTPVTLGPGPKTNPFKAASLKPRPGRPTLRPPRLALSGSHARPSRSPPASVLPPGLLSRVTCLQTLPEAPLSELQNVPRPRVTAGLHAGQVCACVSPPGPGSIHPRPPGTWTHTQNPARPQQVPCDEPGRRRLLRGREPIPFPEKVRSPRSRPGQ